MKLFIKILLISFIYLPFGDLQAQLYVDPNTSQNDLIQSIVGENVSISNVVLNCSSNAFGTFKGYSSNLGIDSGIILSTGNALGAIGPNNSGSTSGQNNYSGDADLNAIISPTMTEDACVLEFDIAPDCDTLGIRFVFGSEEYPEYVNSYNDAFAFFISGPSMPQQNIALLPNSNTPVTISNVNNGAANNGPCSNCNYYTPNGTGAFGQSQYNDPNVIQYDGFTIPLLAKIAVNPCDTYHMKLAIADAGDDSWDSGVFIEAKGLSCISNKSVEMRIDSLVSCGKANGSIEAEVNSGTGPFVYTWANSNGVLNAVNSNDTINVLGGLNQGMYYLTIADASGCDKVDSIYLNKSAQISDSIIIESMVSCPGISDGVLSLAFEGGSPLYDVYWFYGYDTLRNLNNILDTLDTLSQLAAGKYFVKIVDATGCEAIDSVDLGSLYQPSLSLNEEQGISCYGDSTGIIKSNSNMLGALEYIWFGEDTIKHDTLFQKVDSISNLGSGWYFLNLKDSNNCIISDSILISSPDSLKIQLSISQLIECQGDTNASLHLSIQGGLSNYSTYWSNSIQNVNIQSADSLLSLSSGTYSVTVEDDNACQKTQSIVIPHVDSIELNIQALDNTPCIGVSSGRVVYSLEQKNTLYSVQWLDAANQVVKNNNLSMSVVDTLSGLSHSWYYIQVTDSNNCILSDSVFIDTVYSLDLQLAGKLNLDCSSDSNANIYAQLNQTSGPYTFIWNYQDTILSIQAKDSLLDLKAGFYHLRVEDSALCSVEDSVFVSAPRPLEITNIQIDSVQCYGFQNGNLELEIEGGTPYYETQFFQIGVYNVDQNISSDTIFQKTNLKKGDYVLILRDSLNCSRIDTLSIYQPDSMMLSIIPIDSNLCYGDSIASVQFVINGGVDQYKAYWYLQSVLIDSSTSMLSDSVSINSLYKGDYRLNVYDDNLCSIVDSFSILEPDSLSVSALSINTNLCYGDSNASFKINYSGGMNPYDLIYYSPDDTIGLVFGSNASQDSLNGLSAGTYYYLIKDANSCSYLDSILIDQPPFLDVQSSMVQESCLMYCDGEISVQGIGGSPGYQYQWSNLALGAIIDNLCPGHYFLTTTDLNNCERQDTFEIIAPDSILPTIKVLNSCQDSIVSFNASVNSGNILQWNWDLGNGNLAGGDTIFTNYDSVGLYDVCLKVITDLGCKDSVCDSVEVYPNPDFYVQSDTSNGCVPLQILFSAISGDSNLIYYWDFGDGDTSSLKNPFHLYQNSGQFDLFAMVQNEFGCKKQWIESQYVHVYPVPTCAFSVSKSVMKVTDGNI